MPTINLLDWRQERRERRKKQFQVALLAALVVGAGLVYGGVRVVDGDVNYQNARNRYLQQQIAETDRQIKKIEDLQQLKSRLLARMHVIERLEQSRSQIVHYFDQLVATLPKGVYLTKVQEKGASTTLQGDADSNGRVSTYLRNLDGSPWFTDPNLVVITAKHVNGQRVSEFTLKVKNDNPSNNKKKASKASGTGSA